VALLRKVTCDLKRSMYFRHPVFIYTCPKYGFMHSTFVRMLIAKQRDRIKWHYSFGIRGHLDWSMVWFVCGLFAGTHVYRQECLRTFMYIYVHIWKKCYLDHCQYIYRSGNMFTYLTFFMYVDMYIYMLKYE